MARMGSCLNLEIPFGAARESAVWPFLQSIDRKHFCGTPCRGTTLNIQLMPNTANHLRRLPQSHGDDLSLLFTIETFFSGRRLTSLAIQSNFKPLHHEPLTQILHRLHATGKRFGDPSIRPVLSANIRLQQNLSAPDFLRRACQPLAHTRQRCLATISFPGRVASLENVTNGS